MMRTLTFAVLLATPLALAAQRTSATGSDSQILIDSTAVPVPFGPGERLEYKVRLGPVTVGDGQLHVLGVEDVRGFPTYHLRLAWQASTMFGAFKINDRYDSWLDTRMLMSRRFIRDVHQLDYKSRREFEIYPEERRWERVDEDKGGEAPLITLDEIAIIYYLRTLPLEVGTQQTLNRYFKIEDNPVSLKVLRKERIEVEGKVYDTVVVQPILKDGIFAEGGEAEIYFTDDEKRHIVYLRTNVPLVGSLSLSLISATPGVPLNPSVR